MSQTRSFHRRGCDPTEQLASDSHDDSPLTEACFSLYQAVHNARARSGSRGFETEDSEMSVNRRRNISNEQQAMEVVETVLEALRKDSVGQAEQLEMLAILSSMKDDAATRR